MFSVNGEREWVNCRNYSHEEMIKWVDLLHKQSRDNGVTRYRKMWHTKKPSIQGPWTPFTHKSPDLNLVVFPDEKLSQPLDIQQSASEKLLELFEKQKISEQNLDEKQAE